jgi:hypothetical protein
VVYAHTRGSEIPQNKDAFVMAAVAIQTDQDLDIDLSSVEITPHFTLNGKPFSTSVYNSAEFYLEDISGGERIPLGNSHQASEPILILPGIYNVIYSHQNGDLVPQNQDAIIKAAVTIDADQVLEVDVPAVTLRSTYSLNGEPFSVSQYVTAFFSLRNPNSGDTVELGYSHDQYHSTMIISGVYDVVYAHTHGSEIPQNKDAIVMSDVDISSRRALPIDVPAVTLRSTYSLNGEPFSVSQYTKAFFSLRNPDSGDTIALGDSNDQSHSTVIIPGVYDVIYAHTRGSEIPQNQDAIVKAAVAIQADQVLDIDVSSVVVSPHFTLNGKPFSTSHYNSAEFYLEDISGGERIPLGNSHQASEPILILPRIYNVIYSHYNGDLVPQNQDAIVRAAVTIDADQILDIDVSSVEIRPHFTLNGKPFSTSHYNSAKFYLEDISGGERILLGSSHQASEPVLILPRIYNVIYSHYNGDLVPQNQDAIVMSDVSINSSQALAIDVPAVS